MVKDVEECVLGFGYSGEFLNIINNQNVYGLIKTNEIIEMIGTNRVSVLHLKQMC